ncbi:MAG: TIGR02444 family protein [Xanthobacteraceae bacterium]
MPALPEPAPFWRFSLQLYRQPGVADACIALQDGCGVDVNLLLFLFWLAAGGRHLAADEVEKLDDQVRGWRNLTIIPIRDMRRQLKETRTLLVADRQEAFRAKVKAVELEAERLQQEALYAISRSGPLGKAADPGAAVRGNVSAYERLIGASFPESAIAVLLGAFNSVSHDGLGADLGLAAATRG